VTALLSRILVRSFQDLREESFLLILFNFLWMGASVPGMVLLGYGAVARFLPLALLGLLLLLPWPVATFALFQTAADIGERRVVSLGSFLRAGLRTWKVAFAWAGMTLIVLALLLSNARYYGTGASSLGESLEASLISSFMVTLTTLWCIWQGMTLALYPHLRRPGLVAAFRGAGRLIVRQPIPVFLAGLVATLLLAGGVAFPPLGLLYSFSLVAVVANRTVVESSRGLRLEA